MRLYTNNVAANKEIGERIVKIRGISKDVISANKLTETPLLVIRSTKRKDCVSQIMDIRENETNKKPANICLVMYMFSFFMPLIITKFFD